MFRHQGKTRTLKHNLRIASLLSFVAGMVNVAGFFAVQRLTTNVTGHFAFFVDEIFKLNFWQGFVYFLYIFFFFAGSFLSSFLIEIISFRNGSNVYAIPIAIECALLFAIGFFAPELIVNYPDSIAFGLLFAMGLQNSLVTTISNARVRTTHLTGLFTDLGIELSQLFFYKEAKQRANLSESIKLRLTIIGSFFTGGIIGGVGYSKLGTYVLILTAIILITGLIYDGLKFRYFLWRRKSS